MLCFALFLIVWCGSVWSGLVRSCWVWSGAVRLGSVRFSSVWSGAGFGTFLSPYLLDYPHQLPTTPICLHAPAPTYLSAVLDLPAMMNL